MFLLGFLACIGSCPVTSSCVSFGIADLAIVKYLESNSTPTLLRPRYDAAAMVDPAPMNGSSTTPFPRGSEARTKNLINACGFNDGCFARARSCRRAGGTSTRSGKGVSSEGRRRAPVPYLFRFSITRPSHDFRKRSQSSKHARGMTDRLRYCLLPNLGRSPPRSVLTTRTIWPRASKPAIQNAWATKCETKHCDESMTCPPGTRTRNNSGAKRRWKARTPMRS